MLLKIINYKCRKKSNFVVELRDDIFFKKNFMNAKKCNKIAKNIKLIVRKNTSNLLKIANKSHY